MSDQGSGSERREPFETPSDNDKTGSDLAELRAELADAHRRISDMQGALTEARAREQFLTFELQHRVRNMLAVIRSIHRRTWENGASQDEFAEHFRGRLDAVARYQVPVDDVAFPGIELEDIIRNELLDAHCLDRPNCTLSGPPVYLQQTAAELIALAVHELATNSIKFGALAQRGKLRIEWSLAGPENRRTVQLRWTETNLTSSVSERSRKGFGQELIEDALPYQLGATTSFELRPGEFECVIFLPAPPRGSFAKRSDVVAGS